ncbi:MAG: hypothetical protein NTY98_05455 [Verrucomicrobia bacterium]|nr:hypothetical protein [Verrucomicrobiota bacterium]
MWRWRKFSIVAEIVLFFVTVGILAYLSQNLHWKAFWTVTIISTLIYALLKFLEHGPLLEQLAKLEATQTRFALRFEAWGIIDVFNMRHQNEMVLRNAANQSLINNGNDFALLAETAASYLDPSARRHWDFLKTKLEQGRRLRLLIIDPLCDSKQLRNKVNEVTSLIDPKLRLDLLKKLQLTYPSNVEIRFTKEIYCSIFITDKGLIYDPYHLGREASRLENYFIAIEIAKAGDEKAYWLLYNHFENLWRDAERFDDWMSRNEDLPPF